jgi:DHA1 family bicyclomycin/chloramphenicol resistance-like MFS transporter
MKILKETNVAISTLLAFALIPLSGFATDIYLPSFPTMASFFGTGQGDIQLSLVVFVVSSGVGQLFVGSLLDSFGRYRISLASLIIFAVSCFVIANTHSLSVVLAMRVIQGLAVALIVVGKRAFFMDLYSGEKLKHYTSLFSIIWATAPITAPFIGGFLHHYFGWESNFYFLGTATLILLVLELRYGGETLKVSHPFKLRHLLRIYVSKLETADFSLSLVILGLCFSMVILYSMASPFIIEQVFHQSAVTTGNCSLLSGLAVMIGGLLSKSSMQRSLYAKMSVAGPALFVLSIVMIITLRYMPSLSAMMTIVMALHIVSGFTFNTFYSHALGRFTTNAGIVSGITGGGTYIITSLLSYALVRVLDVQNLVILGMAYLLIASLIGGSFILFIQAHRRTVVREQPSPAAV